MKNSFSFFRIFNLKLKKDEKVFLKKANFLSVICTKNYFQVTFWNTVMCTLMVITFKVKIYWHMWEICAKKVVFLSFIWVTFFRYILRYFSFVLLLMLSNKKKALAEKFEKFCIRNISFWTYWKLSTAKKSIFKFCYPNPFYVTFFHILLTTSFFSLK